MAKNGSIAVGDLLVTSDRPGFAMKAGSKTIPGTIVGKALEPPFEKLAQPVGQPLSLSN